MTIGTSTYTLSRMHDVHHQWLRDTLGGDEFLSVARERVEYVIGIGVAYDLAEYIGNTISGTGLEVSSRECGWQDINGGRFADIQIRVDVDRDPTHISIERKVSNTLEPERSEG